MSFVPPLFHPFVFSCTSVIKFTVVKNDCVLLGRRTIVYYWEEERLCTTGEKNDCVLLGGKSDCVLLYWGGENDCVLQSLGEKQLCTTVGKTSCVLLGGGGGGGEGGKNDCVLLPCARKDGCIYKCGIVCFYIWKVVHRINMILECVKFS